MEFSFRRIADPGDLKIVEPHCARYELLGRHARIEIEPQVLSRAVRAWNCKREFHVPPCRRHPPDHVALADRLACPAGTRDAPFQSARAQQRTLVFGLE